MKPNIPEGYEELTPERLRADGAIEGMRYRLKVDDRHPHPWSFEWPADTGHPMTESALQDFWFIAPLPSDKEILEWLANQDYVTLRNTRTHIGFFVEDEHQNEISDFQTNFQTLREAIVSAMRKS